MRTLLIVLIATAAVHTADKDVLFDDDLKGDLKDGWSWLRAEDADWRTAEGGLEIHLRPGDANTVRNALVRPLPEHKGPIAIEVTVTFLSPPTEQYEQAGITLYRGNKPVFKLVHERVDGNLVVVPGKKPTPKMTVRLRLVIDDGKFRAQFREEGETEYTTSAEGDLKLSGDVKVSLQGYHGPEKDEHWVRFSDFVIGPAAS